MTAENDELRKRLGAAPRGNPAASFAPEPQKEEGRATGKPGVVVNRTPEQQRLVDATQAELDALHASRNGKAK
jgi:hypothetical protein